MNKTSKKNSKPVASVHKILCAIAKKKGNYFKINGMSKQREMTNDRKRKIVKQKKDTNGSLKKSCREKKVNQTKRPLNDISDCIYLTCLCAHTQVCISMFISKVSRSLLSQHSVKDDKKKHNG